MWSNFASRINAKHAFIGRKLFNKRNWRNNAMSHEMCQMRQIKKKNFNAVGCKFTVVFGLLISNLVEIDNRNLFLLFFAVICCRDKTESLIFASYLY